VLTEGCCSEGNSHVCQGVFVVIPASLRYPPSVFKFEKTGLLPELCRYLIFKGIIPYGRPVAYNNFGLLGYGGIVMVTSFKVP